MIDKIVQLITSKYKNVSSIVIPLGEVLSTPHEVIVVIEDLRPIISVEHIDVENESIRIIIVSKTVVLADVYYDVLGGILSSRITSLAKIIYDKGFWVTRLVEEYKERIFLKELDFLLGLGELMLYAKIPCEYFPVKNFSTYIGIDKSLAELIVESYAILGDKLLLKMREDYEHVVKKNINEQAITLENGYIRVRNLNAKTYINTRISRTVKAIKSLREIITPITSQIVSVLMRLQSKADKEAEAPTLFKYPHLIIELEEGILALGDWKELLEDTKGKLQRIGRHSFIDSAELYKLDGSKVIIKQYFALTGIKWLLASMVAFISKKFSVLPSERQVNEYKAIVELKGKNIPVKDVILVDPINYVTVFKYIEGNTMWMLKDEYLVKAYELTGKLLARIHSCGLVVGDTKPDNFIYNHDKDQVYVIDLEQAKRSFSIEEQAWDVAMFIYFHGLKSLTSNVINALRVFLDSYASIMGWKPINEAARIKYVIPFASLIPLQQLIKLQGLLK